MVVALVLIVHISFGQKSSHDRGFLEEGFVAPKVKPVVKTAITKAEYKALIARTSHDTTQPDGSLYRSIKPETAEFYGHLYARDSEGNIIEEYYPETKEGFNGDLKSLRGYKKRVLPKDFGKGNIGITGLSNDFVSKVSLEPVFVEYIVQKE